MGLKVTYETNDDLTYRMHRFDLAFEKTKKDRRVLRNDRSKNWERNCLDSKNKLINLTNSVCGSALFIKKSW